MLEFEDKILTRCVLIEKAPFFVECENVFLHSGRVKVKNCVDINEYIKAFNTYNYSFKEGSSIHSVDIKKYFIVMEGNRECDIIVKSHITKI